MFMIMAIILTHPCIVIPTKHYHTQCNNGLWFVIRTHTQHTYLQILTHTSFIHSNTCSNILRYTSICYSYFLQSFLMLHLPFTQLSAGLAWPSLPARLLVCLNFQLWHLLQYFLISAIDLYVFKWFALFAWVQHFYTLFHFTLICFYSFCIYLTFGMCYVCIWFVLS